MGSATINFLLWMTPLMFHFISLEVETIYYKKQFI